jgi:hypothetical protein
LVACLAAILAFVCAVAPALADEQGDVPGQPYPLSEVEASGGSSNDLTEQLIDPKAAKELPHRDLDRAEAAELAESVFGSLLESSAGPFGDLHVEEFLSDTAAIVTPTQPDAAVTIGGEQAATEEAENADGPLLLDTTLPLRTENDAGQDRVVDLDLEHDDGELQPANPLIEVGIPDELGEGITLPSGDIELGLSQSAEDRSPSLLADNVAFYPNVATDTDFAVATTPTGLETFTQLRSADAPQSQTLHLNLDEGVALGATPEGGAVAMSGTEEALKVMPPTAIDANGDSVPASLEVSGSSLVLSASTDETTAFPVLLDPVIIESWPWYEKNTSQGMDGGNGTGTGDWRSWRNTTAFSATYNVPWSTPPSPLKMWMPGLNVTSGYSGTVAVGSQANWNYYVPRYFSDYEKYGTRPTSFIQNMQMWNLQYATYSSQVSPWLATGLWDGNLGKWVSLYTRNGFQGSIGAKDWSLLYNFPNGNYIQSVKNAGFGLLSDEAGANNGRILYAGYAAISLNDLITPSIGEFSEPEGWSNDAPSGPITVVANDTGLGVQRLVAEPQGVSSPPKWEAKGPGCSGLASETCPRSFKFTGGSFGVVGTGVLGKPFTEGAYYNPAIMPQGISKVKVVAEDVLGNKSPSVLVPVKVDHTAPALTLSGTMTQQASLGASRPQYVLHLGGSDGTTGSPQAGIASSKVTVDGKQVDEMKAGCATQNCTLSRDWTLKSDSYPGSHEVVASVTDGAGITMTKKLTINIQPDTTAPKLATSGALREAPDGWVEQVSKSVSAFAEDPDGYGITSLTFSIDGKVVKSVSQTCDSGSCGKELVASPNMASYSGGAHTAEVVAKDGAGNVSKETWTINVNPKGSVPSSEAAETLEAADETSDSTAVAPTSEVIDPAEIEAGNDPALVAGGSGLESTGTGANSSMTVDAGNGFTIDTGSETFHIEPTEAASSETNLEVTSEVAGVAANTTTGVDTVVRPIYDGIQEFQSIRTSGAPETYSWKVQLHGEQSLKAIDEQQAGIFYPEESSEAWLAMTITAEEAHDAIGKTVPTSLNVSEGNILTLTVKHKGGGFVYPITAGPTWQTGYETYIVKGPPTKQEEEEAESNSALTWEGYLGVSAPEPIDSSDGEATASGQGGLKKHWLRVVCSHKHAFSSAGRPYEDACGNPFQGKPGVEIAYLEAYHGKFFYKYGQKVWHEGGPTDSIGCATNHDSLWPEPMRDSHIDRCVWWGKTSNGNGGASATSGHHITPVAKVIGEERGSCGNECGGTLNDWEQFSLPFLVSYLWPSGAVQVVETDCIEC